MLSNLEVFFFFKILIYNLSIRIWGNYVTEEYLILYLYSLRINCQDTLKFNPLTTIVRLG